ncbi:MAG: hypothetical protein AABW81_00635, partial [Nanoarchaeota archaeon]
RCADTCDFAEHPDLLCTQAITEGCDCGANKCWDDDKCKINPRVENKTEDDDDEEDNDKNETEDEDCWQCSKWSMCVNNTKTRTCTEKTNCTNEDEDEDETPKTTKRCELKREIKHYYINGDCPEECTCTGSVVKCELASGRMMTVHAGKSGNVIVQIKGVNMSTNVTLYKNENGTITGMFKGNKTREIKIMPDEAKERIKEKIKNKIEKEDIKLDEFGIYKIRAHKKAKLFFIIPVSESVEGDVDSETGIVLIRKNGS